MRPLRFYTMRREPAKRFEVFCAPFIIEDERRDFMEQALFEHEQPTEATVTSGEGMDTLEAYVEGQDLCQLDFVEAFVFRNQGAHLGTDVLGQCGFGLTQGTGISAVLAWMKQELTLRHGAVAEHGMQLADVGLGNSRCGCIDDMADTGNVVIRLDQVIHLDRLKARGNLTFLVDFLHLGEHEPVACQTV